MHWKECKKHQSIYYDSAVHKRCPVCVNKLLQTALFKWGMVELKQFCFGYAILKWNGHFLHALKPSTSQEQKSKSDAEAETAYAKAREIQKTIVSERKELVDFIIREDILLLLPKNDMYAIRKRMAETLSN